MELAEICETRAKKIRTGEKSVAFGKTVDLKPEKKQKHVSISITNDLLRFVCKNRTFLLRLATTSQKI